MIHNFSTTIISNSSNLQLISKPSIYALIMLNLKDMRNIITIIVFLLTSCFIYGQYYTPSQLDNINSNTTAIEGDLYLDTINDNYYIGLTNGELGKIFPYGTTITNTSDVCNLLKPSVNENSYKMAINETRDISLFGYNFSDSVTVTIPGVTINNFNLTSATEFSIGLTAPAAPDTFDIIVSNACGNDTAKDALIVLTTTWLDLRNGGDAFTFGTGAGNDIRYRAGMNLVRNANGMYFTGQNPWNSWVKFESEQFTRGSGTTVEWIFRFDGAFMVGISPLTNDEGSGSQFVEGSVMSYFNNANNFWGLYGSSPTNGTTWNQPNGTGITNGGIFKLKIENDGSLGQTITLYELPNGNQANWNDESTIVTSIVSTNSNLQSPLVPFIIPRNSANNYFIALRVL